MVHMPGWATQEAKRRREAAALAAIRPEPVPRVPREYGDGREEEDPAKKGSFWGGGRQPALGLLGLAPVPGPGFLAAGINAGLGIEAAQQQAQLMSRLTGRPAQLGPADLIGAGSGLPVGGYGGGLGGYGNLGRGGIEGAIDMADPGVAGPARAVGRDAVAAMEAESLTGPAEGSYRAAQEEDGEGK